MVGKLKDDCQKYTEYVHEQVLKSYLDQWSLHWVSWELEVNVVPDKLKGNNTRFKIMERLRYLLSKQNHT